MPTPTPTPPSQNHIFSTSNIVQLIGMAVIALSIFFNMEARVNVVETKLEIMQKAYDKQIQELKDQRTRDLNRFEKSVDKLADRIEKLTSKIDMIPRQ